MKPGGGAHSGPMPFVAGRVGGQGRNTKLAGGRGLRQLVGFVGFSSAGARLGVHEREGGRVCFLRKI